MGNGLEILSDRIARLRVLVTLPEGAAPLVASAIGKELDRQIAAGTDPDGTPWEPRQADGGKPLRGTAGHIAVGVVGSTVIARLRSKHHVLHQFGCSKGRVRRQILPSGAIPDRMAKAIRTALERKFGEIVGGG